MVEHLTGIWNEIASLWFEMGAYLVFGFMVAGVLSRLLRRESIARHLGSESLGPVAKASLFGVPLPLCSCGVIPVGLSLYRRGASRGATISFLISTPQTGVDSILITYAFLGPVFTIVRPIAAFLNGVLGGWAVSLTHRDADVCEHRDSEDDPDTSGTDGERVSLGRHAALAIRYAFVDFPREIVGWLVVGLAVAGVIAHFVPDAWLQQYLGAGFAPMVLMAVVGIPLYICATASVPLVAVLLAKGLSPGAGLVFLMTGPATNTAALLLIARTLGKRAAGIYLASIVLTSFVCGYFLDLYFGAGGFSLALSSAHEHTEAYYLQLAGALGLVVIVAGGLAGNAMEFMRARRAKAGVGPAAFELEVKGMTCQGCAGTVRKAAESAAGVTGAAVDLKRGVVSVSGDVADAKVVVAAIEAAGYETSLP